MDQCGRKKKAFLITHKLFTLADYRHCTNCQIKEERKTFGQCTIYVCVCVYRVCDTI